MRSLLTLGLWVCTLLLAAQTEPPNMIIFIADDVSWDDIGAYGNKDVQTPNIDQLAYNGIRFTNTYLTASSCSPSRNSILTGRYPHNTGAAELHTNPPLNMVAFPELLKENGYYTAHSGKFHSGPYARRAYDYISERRAVGDGGENEWLQLTKDRPKHQPFFFWFAAFDAHRPWGPNDLSGTHQPAEATPPFYLVDGEQTRADLAKYYDEIHRFDQHIGLVVDELRNQNALENTMIIIMADNGRPFPHSKTRVNDRGMKTPFIVSWPAGISQSAVSEALVSAIDIAPTMLSLAGATATDQFQGQSFEQLLKSPQQGFRNYLFAEHNWHDYEAHERMVRSRQWMYIVNSRPEKPQMGPADAVESPSQADLQAARESGGLTQIQADIFQTPRPYEELYDCDADPHQLLNVAAVPEKAEELQAMRDVLTRWINETDDTTPARLTPDWFQYEPGYIRTPFHGLRGEMPGSRKNAVANNNKGPF